MRDGRRRSWSAEEKRQIVEETLVPAAAWAGSPAAAMPARIEIALTGGVRVRIEGAVDPAAVTAAVAAVMKARRRR